MSAQRKRWNVRAPAMSSGKRESTAKAYWPGNSPKPKESSPYARPLVPTVPLRLRSKPLAIPVLDGKATA